MSQVPFLYTTTAISDHLVQCHTPSSSQRRHRGRSVCVQLLRMSSIVARHAWKPYWYALIDLTDQSVASNIHSYTLEQWHTTLVPQCFERSIWSSFFLYFALIVLRVHLSGIIPMVKQRFSMSTRKSIPKPPWARNDSISMISGPIA